MCGAVIGADGLGFHDDAQGRHKVPQIATVEIGDDLGAHAYEGLEDELSTPDRSLARAFDGLDGWRRHDPADRP